MIVVLRDIETRPGLQLGTGIIEQTGCRHPSIRNRLRIQEWLERRTRLSRRQHGIDLGRTAQRARRTDPRQHLASRVIQYQHGAVLNVARAQFAQLTHQRLRGEALQWRAQRSADFLHAGPAPALAHPLGQNQPSRMPGNPLAWIKRLALQRLPDLLIQPFTRFVGCRLLHECQDTARAPGYIGGPGVGATNQRRCHRGFAVVQTVRRFAKQCAAQRIDAHHFTAERHEIEIGLKNLILAPAQFQPLRRQGLTHLLPEVASVFPAPQIGVEQPRQLHRDGRGPPGLLVPEIFPGGCGDRAPIHAAVFIKPLVLTQDDGGAQRSRNLVKFDPLASTHLRVGAYPVQEFAIPIQDADVGRLVRRLDLVERLADSGRPGLL